MAKVFVVIFVMISLGFLIVGCTAPMGIAESIGIVGQRGPKGISGLEGDAGLRGDAGEKAGRGDIAILMTSLSNLKRSYYANIDEFNLQKNDIDTKALFDHIVFKGLFKLNNPKNGRDDVYASLKHNIEDIQTVKQIVESLTNSSNSMLEGYAKDLLIFLRDSARCIKEVIYLLENELDILQKSNDLEGISELSAMLVEMLYRREGVLDAIRNVLDSTKLFLVNLFILHHIENVRFKLDPIVLLNGKIHKKIYVDYESLKNLRDAIEKKVNNIKRILDTAILYD
ncbi:hypothetical protein BOFE_08730 (plasmid) [Candidatus Borrelia fainii]|uniref:Lipoprotein n=1 Tax=Candidatus Borrelia fainii TaxID=2518322 RepID=A0ABM8DL65_9SPIR|nr:CRASP family complement regulator-acquiring lipoprotein [Candidatus Borrelia fainii]BDU63333.1 hypothetical protein BOFE_08730 [Candidatus Borrelia fainii]